MIERVVPQVERMLRISLQLGDDVALNPQSDLVNEIGLDSLEAFEAMATLHELLGVAIPDDTDPRSFATIATISERLISAYDPAVVESFVSMDIAARLAELDDRSYLL